MLVIVASISFSYSLKMYLRLVIKIRGWVRALSEVRLFLSILTITLKSLGTSEHVRTPSSSFRGSYDWSVVPVKWFTNEQGAMYRATRDDELSRVDFCHGRAHVARVSYLYYGLACCEGIRWSFAMSLENCRRESSLSVWAVTFTDVNIESENNRRRSDFNRETLVIVFE